MRVELGLQRLMATVGGCRSGANTPSWLTLWLTLPTRTPTVVVAANLGHRRTRAAHATDPFGESQAARVPPSTPSCSCSRSRSILLGWSFRSPIWRGGGRAHGPVIRDWSQKLPKKGGCVWLPVAHACFRSSVDTMPCRTLTAMPCTSSSSSGPCNSPGCQVP